MAAASLQSRGLLAALAFVLLTAPSNAGAATSDPARLVDPFIGTGGRGTPTAGQTYPGASLPSGMVQFSPVSAGDGGFGGYAYEADAIRGFSFTRLSGAGCASHGNFSLMPLRRGLDRFQPDEPAAYASTFRHGAERASPGSYRVGLDSGVGVDLTATLRSGFASIRYPAGATGSLLLDAGAAATRRERVSVQVAGEDEVRGSQRSSGFCGGPATTTVYFAARFDRPFALFGTWGQDGIVRRGVRSRRAESAAGALLSFDTRSRRTVQVKVGISYVSERNAALNLRRESPAWSLAEVRARARAAWNAALRRIEVRGGTATERRIFATALYHSLLHPSVFSDVDGRYVGRDGRIHVARGYTQLTNVAGWDVYRSQVPLLALVAPRRANDLVRSLLAGSGQAGRLSKWLLAGTETGVMVGDSADPIIASAYAFGARLFPAEAALRAMVRGATELQPGPFAYPSRNATGYVQRPGLRQYLELGYVPLDHGDGYVWGPAATTLEYATDDFAIAALAGSLGKTALERAFLARAGSWRNVFNPQTGFVEPRLRDGSFLPAFDHRAGVGFAEGNAWQYTWMVPHDLGALLEAVGGRERAVEKLDLFFGKLNAGADEPHMWIGNEPSLLTPWVYLWAGAPWRTQEVVRQIGNEVFRATPAGLPGQDDLGALSSWYVWSSLGLYPAIPGVGGLAVGSPRFPEVAIRLAGGRVLRIRAPGASAGAPYVHGLRLDGSPYARTWIPFTRLARGARLEFSLGRAPSPSWGSGPSAAPPSFGR